MKRTFLIIAAAIVAIFTIGIAYASIPAADGTINGCYKNANGDLIVIDSTATCPFGHTALNWNQTGPPGQSGVTSFYTVIDIIDIPTDGSVVAGETNCLAGDAITGLAERSDYGGVKYHLPKAGTNPSGSEWSIGGVAANEGDHVELRIICADL
jgi:hypothetical protein